VKHPLKLLLILLLALAVGCGDSLDEDEGGSDQAASGEASSQSLTVGSANFPENVLLAEIYAAALEAKGIKVSKKLNIGSREAIFPALEKGDLHLLPEYTGALASYVTKGKGEGTTTEDQVADIKGALPTSLTLLEPALAEDKDSVTCTKEVTDKYSLKSLEDLAKVSDQLVMGGPPELEKRKGFGLPGLKEVYGIEFKEFKALDVAGPLTVSALKDGKVDCANLFTTQSAIAVNGFVSLEDPKGLIAAQNVIPLIAKDKATPEVTEALNAVSAKLDTETLTGLVKRVEVDKDDAATVAEDWLSSAGLGAS
jgi:osmoprotectant transport system substrate-binding protein